MLTSLGYFSGNIFSKDDRINKQVEDFGIWGCEAV